MLRVRFGFLAALASTLALGCSSTTIDTEPSQANPLDSQEDALFSALATFRKMKSLPPIALCASLDVSASLHADDMRNNNYLSDTAPDGSSVLQRACKAGFKAACDKSPQVAEFVASGEDSGTSTFSQWIADSATSPLLENPQFIVGGVGRSIGDTKTFWALDVASMTDPSCKP